MSYDPTLGRFLERDPIGERGNTLAESELMLNAEQHARTTLGNLVGTHHKNDRWLWQYADGMNTYQFAHDNPVNRTDPSGLQVFPQDPGF